MKPLGGLMRGFLWAYDGFLRDFERRQLPFRMFTLVSSVSRSHEAPRRQGWQSPEANIWSGGQGRRPANELTNTYTGTSMIWSMSASIKTLSAVSYGVLLSASPRVLTLMGHLISDSLAATLP